MLTVKFRKGQLATNSSFLTSEYRDFMDQVSLLDSDTWLINYQDIPRFSEEQISKLCLRFHVHSGETVLQYKLMKTRGGKRLPDDLKILKECIDCIPVSTAECERSFSVMNIILTEKRNRMKVDSLSALMFISIVGPAQVNFNPKTYASKWLSRDRHSAFDRDSVKRKMPKGDLEYHSHLNDMLG
jgi:hypothetical protein